MICPACHQDAGKRPFGRCAACKTPLEVFRYQKDGESFKEFRIKDQKFAEEVQARPVVGTAPLDTEGRLLTELGANPEILLLSTNRYKVIYRMEIPTGWMYCPNCNRRMFQNMVLNSIHIEQEHKCDGCDAIVAYVFITNPVLLT